MLTLLKYAYSTRLKSSKHAKMSANKMKQDPQYNNMQQWGIQLSLERVIEIDSKLINLTKLLNYITEKQKEQE